MPIALNMPTEACRISCLGDKLINGAGGTALRLGELAATPAKRAAPSPPHLGVYGAAAVAHLGVYGAAAVAAEELENCI